MVGMFRKSPFSYIRQAVVRISTYYTMRISISSEKQFRSHWLSCKVICSQLLQIGRGESSVFDDGVSIFHN